MHGMTWVPHVMVCATWLKFRVIVKRLLPKVITKFGPGVATKDRYREYIYKFYKHAYGKIRRFLAHNFGNFADS